MNRYVYMKMLLKTNKTTEHQRAKQVLMVVFITKVLFVININLIFVLFNCIMSVYSTCISIINSHMKGHTISIRSRWIAYAFGGKKFFFWTLHIWIIYNTQHPAHSFTPNYEMTGTKKWHKTKVWRKAKKLI